MIFGSGTGGAIAVYLGRLNLTIKECEDHYKRLGEEVYARPCSAWNPFCRFNYDSERLEQVLKEQTKPFIPANANTLEFSHQRRINPDCKVCVRVRDKAYEILNAYQSRVDQDGPQCTSRPPHQIVRCRKRSSLGGNQGYNSHLLRLSKYQSWPSPLNSSGRWLQQSIWKSLERGYGFIYSVRLYDKQRNLVYQHWKRC